MKTGDTHAPSHPNPPPKGPFSHSRSSLINLSLTPDFQMLTVETYKIIVTGSPLAVFSWANTEYFWFVMMTSFQA